jgi:thioesterase domain-containing protein
VAKHLRIIARLNLRENYAYISSRIQRRLFSRLQHSRKSEIEQRIAEGVKHCLRAYHAHRPEVFSGRIVLVRASGLDPSDWDDPSGTRGWSSVCKGGVDVIPMAGRHADILKEPHVTDLAAHINNLLKAIDG